MSFFVDSQLRKLLLDKEISYLETLAALADHWEALAQGLPDDIEDIIDLVLRFDSVRQEIESKLGELNIDIEPVSELIGKLHKKIDDRIPERAEFLLVPISEYAELDEERIVHWNFLSLDKSRSGKIGKNDLGFDLGMAAEARLEIEPGDQPDFRSDDMLLRLAFTGEVRGNVGLSAEKSWGPISARAGSTGSGSLTYWFAVPRNSSLRLIRSVAEKLREVANPFDLQSINNRATKSGLDRISFATKFEFPKELTMRFNIAPKMGVPRIVENEISFTARALRHRLLNVEAYREGEELVVGLALSKVRSTQRGTQWSFGVDVSDIASAVRDYVAGLSTDIAEFKQDYGDLLSPGSWAKKNMQELFVKWLKPVTEAKDDFERLKDEFVSHMDEGKRLLSGELDEVSDRFSQNLKKRLPEQYSSRIDDALSGLLGKLGEAIDSEIAKRVTGVVEGSEKAAAEFFKRVDNLTKAVEAEVDAVGTKADNATERVRAVLARLEEVVANLTNALAKAATAKLQLRLWHEESIRGGQEAETSLRFRVIDQNAGAIYAQLLRGELSELRKLIDQPDSGILVDGAEFREFLDHSTERGLAISLLGFEFEEKNIFKQSSVITVDKNGHVLVHTNAARAIRIRSPWEAQQVALMSQFDLWSAAKSRSASFCISATKEDSNLKLHELEDLLDDLVREELITQHVLDRAKRVVAEKAQPRTKLRATVDLRLALLNQDVEELLRAADQVEDGSGAIDRVLKTLVKTGAFSADAINRAAREARSLLPPGLRRKLDGSVADVFKYFRPVPAGHSRNRWRQFTALEFAKTRTSANRSIAVPGDASRALRNAQQIHRLVKGYAVLLRCISRLAAMDSRKSSTKEIQKWQGIVNLCLTPWLKVSRAFIVHPQDELHEITLAFLVLLASDAGMPLGSETESAVSVAITFDGNDAPCLIS